MTISRNTFDAARNYKRVRYHQDRDLLDSELNEAQDIALAERRKIADLLLKEGAILSGLGVTAAENILTLEPRHDLYRGPPGAGSGRRADLRRGQNLGRGLCLRRAFEI